MTDSVFSYETPDESPGFLLWQTTVMWQRLIKKELDQHNVAHSHFVIMASLLWFEENQQESTQISIIRSSKLDKMTVSKALKKMTIQGYVKRGESEKDPRAKWVKLTVKGKKLISSLIPLVEALDEKFFASISKTERKMMNGFFGKIIAASTI